MSLGQSFLIISQLCTLNPNDENVMYVHSECIVCDLIQFSLKLRKCFKSTILFEIKFVLSNKVHVRRYSYRQEYIRLTVQGTHHKLCAKVVLELN